MLMCLMNICRTTVMVTDVVATINGIYKHVAVWQMLKPPLVM